MVFASGSCCSDRLFILAQAVAEDCARVLTNGEADSLAAGACVARGDARSVHWSRVRHPATRERINAPYGAELIPVGVLYRLCLRDRRRGGGEITAENEHRRVRAERER